MTTRRGSPQSVPLTEPEVKVVLQVAGLLLDGVEDEVGIPSVKVSM